MAPGESEARFLPRGIKKKFHSPETKVQTYLYKTYTSRKLITSADLLALIGTDLPR
jgi:hypothetical protein